MKKITASFPGAKVLVVEDYFVNYELTREMLEMMDCEVDVVTDGEAAVTASKENHYDVIFMDIQMPKMDGYEATSHIKKFNDNVPIIAVTANALAGDREKCLAAGMNDYISKPIRGEDLENTLIKYIGDKKR